MSLRTSDLSYSTHSAYSSILFRRTKLLSSRKRTLGDRLNLYAAIWIVNVINICIWFSVKPTVPDNTVKTAVTSMTAVLTTTITLRTILSVHESLTQGGAYAGSVVSSSNLTPSTYVLSGAGCANPVPPHPTSFGPSPVSVSNSSVEAELDSEGMITWSTSIHAALKGKGH